MLKQTHNNTLYLHISEENQSARGLAKSHGDSTTLIIVRENGSKGISEEYRLNASGVIICPPRSCPVFRVLV